MAKKTDRSGSGERENKSQAIRDYIKAHSDEGPTAVAKALNEAHNWNITPAYVSTIKNKMSERQATRRRRGGRPPAAAAVATRGFDERALLQAKKLADDVGGIHQAKAALELLGRLTS